MGHFEHRWYIVRQEMVPFSGTRSRSSNLNESLKYDSLALKNDLIWHSIYYSFECRNVECFETGRVLRLLFNDIQIQLWNYDAGIKILYPIEQISKAEHHGTVQQYQISICWPENEVILKQTDNREINISDFVYNIQDMIIQRWRHWKE